MLEILKDISHIPLPKTIKMLCCPKEVVISVPCLKIEDKGYESAVVSPQGYAVPKEHLSFSVGAGKVQPISKGSKTAVSECHSVYTE